MPFQLTLGESGSPTFGEVVDGLLPGLPVLTGLLFSVNWTRVVLNSHGQKQKPFVETFPDFSNYYKRNLFLREPCKMRVFPSLRVIA